MKHSQAQGRADTPHADTVADVQQPNTHEKPIPSGDKKRQMANIVTPLVVAKVGTKNQNATYRYLTHIYSSDYADEYFFQLLNDDYERRELHKDIRILKTLVRKIERVMNLDPDIWVADKDIYTLILQDYIVKFSALLGHAEYFLTAIQEPDDDLIQGS